MNQIFLLIFFYIFYIYIYIYISISKDLSAKYHQANKQRLQKIKARERYQSLSKEKKEKKLHYGSK